LIRYLKNFAVFNPKLDQIEKTKKADRGPGSNPTTYSLGVTLNIPATIFV